MDNRQTEQFNVYTTLMVMCLRMMELLQIIQSFIRFGVSGAAGKSVGCLLIIVNGCGMLCYIHNDMAVVMLDMWYAVDVSVFCCDMLFGICCCNYMGVSYYMLLCMRYTVVFQICVSVFDSGTFVWAARSLDLFQ